jgi:hypothetical protein
MVRNRDSACSDADITASSAVANGLQTPAHPGSVVGMGSKSLDATTAFMSPALRQPLPSCSCV